MTIKLPDDIIKQVNKNNWGELFDKYMTVKTNVGVNYVWAPDVMKEFIKKLVEEEKMKDDKTTEKHEHEFVVVGIVNKGRYSSAGKYDEVVVAVAVCKKCGHFIYKYLD